MVFKAVIIHGRAQLQIVRSLNCETGFAALQVAKRPLDRCPTSIAVEVWRDKQRLGRLYRPVDPLALRYPGAA